MSRLDRDALIAERARLQQRLDEIDAILRGELRPSMSFHEQVRTMVDMDPSKEWTADEIGSLLVGAISESGRKPTAAQALSRLARSGHIEKVRHGRYRGRQ